jgi:hypothetical protein
MGGRHAASRLRSCLQSFPLEIMVSRAPFSFIGSVVV